MEERVEELRRKLEEEQRRRRQAEKELKFYKAAINAMPNPIFLKDEGLRFVFFNQAYVDFFPLEKEEKIGKRVEELEYLSQEERIRFQKEDTIMRDNLSILQCETSFKTLDGSVKECFYWSKGFEIEKGGERGLVGEIVDISSEKQIQKELSQSMNSLKVLMRDAKTSANTDSLTKLYNRNILEKEIPDFIENAKNMNQVISMMLIDIDYFKQLNDQYGHLFGDKILSKMGEIVKRIFRQKDISIRYGGDEFMLILPGADVTITEKMAQRFRHAVCEGLQLEEGFCVTLSIGITSCRKEDTLESFIERADEALYKAKKAGRNTVSSI